MDLYYVWVVLGFLATVLFIEGLYLTWNAYRGPEALRIERRLRTISAGGESLDQAPLLKKRVLSEVPSLDRMLLALPRIHALDRFLLQSGLNINVAEFLAVAAAMVIAVAAACVLFEVPALVGLAVAAGLVAFWTGVVQYSRARRLRAIDRQLPDALDLLARAMQAGHAFSSALRLVATEALQPIGQEFQTVFDEINFGMSTDQALTNLAVRVHSRDLRFFVVAVLVQRETGGNLADILTGIARLIRERQKLTGTIRVLSAEGRISAWVLTILPFVIGAAIFFVNRRFLAQLWTDPVGVRMLATTSILMVGGIWWMWRMVRFRI